MNQFIKIAKDAAENGVSLNEGGPFGAVITDKNGNVISIGNNFNPLSNCERPLPPPKITIFFIFITIKVYHIFLLKKMKIGSFYPTINFITFVYD